VCKYISVVDVIQVNVEFIPLNHLLKVLLVAHYRWKIVGFYHYSHNRIKMILRILEQLKDTKIKNNKTTLNKQK
jgi:hypothetical protein